MGWVKSLLGGNPELALFIALAAGYALGRIRFWRIQLGGICGTLIVALVVGQAGVTLDDGVKNLAFALFIFTLGFTAGPQFVASLNRKGLTFGLLSVIEVVTVLAFVTLVAWALSLDQGTAAGVLAGGATESAVLGTATEAIGRLSLPADQVRTLQANVATAYTISYLFGLVTIVLFSSQVAPMLLRVDLRAEARRLWERLGGTETAGSGQAPALPDLVGRMHRVEEAAGATVAELEAGLRDRATVERVDRGGQELTVAPDLRLERGDLVLLVGHRTELAGADARIGPEESGGDDGLALVSRDVVFTSKGLNHQPLGELRRKLGRAGHGVYLSGLTRTEKPLPAQPGTVLNHGDVVTITGAPRDVDRAAKLIGYPVSQATTDFVYLGLGLIVGILVGQVTVPIGPVNATLGTGGGALVAGLLFGWARAKHPTFGGYPPAAAQVVKDFGLATFIAAVGLSAGPQAIELIQRYGLALPLAGILTVLIPASISLVVGRKLLKLEAPILLGAIAGQQCSTPAISAVVSAAGNTIPMVGYTITYAISNVLLPLLGPVIVAIAGAVGG